MDVDQLFDQTLAHMESTAHGFAARVQVPQELPYKDGFVFRYVERTVHQALVQKLARMVSTLHAARLLMARGFVQEQATLQRVLDELQEDITFLSLGVVFDKMGGLHQEYLDAFFEEEFDAESAIESTQKRPMIPRRRIRAWIADCEAASVDPSRGVELSRTLSKAYSGFVHAASPHIMDMYGGSPPHFHMRGMAGTPRHFEHRADLWNLFYRGILAFAATAKAFGDDDLFENIRGFAREFAGQSGKNYESDEWNAV
jgi:hypothetical protein